MRRFVNLTAGLEWAEFFDARGAEYDCVRIQSTALEQKRLDHVLLTLGASFLTSLARGHRVSVYDCGARKPRSRALWQGLPWIRYCTERAWFGRAHDPIVSRNGEHRVGVSRLFDRWYRDLPSSTVRELKHYRRYLPSDSFYVVIRGVSMPVGTVPGLSDCPWWDERDAEFVA